MWEELVLLGDVFMGKYFSTEGIKFELAPLTQLKDGDCLWA